MQTSASFVIVILLQSISLMFHIYGLHETTSHDILKHSSPFPFNFLFGTASSAYQYEGAYLTDGKSLNNWDVFTHEHPENILDESNGDVAVDQYHRFMEDVDLMISLGVKSYRFSISWSRVLPRGRFGGINYSGIKYYNIVIDTLISRGIKPFVTLNHMDYPQEFENRFQGWLSLEMQKEFVYLADLCFKHFGNRVKYWTMINEPNQQLILSYKNGIFPPARCSLPYGNCSQGNSETEPFIAAHNMILAHAKSVKHIPNQISETSWFEPVSDSTVDKEAAERAQSFYSNWILDPVMYGTYPKEMVKILGPALPQFSTKEVNNLKNSKVDFMGINHYTSYFIQDCLVSACNTGSGAFKADGFALRLDRIGNVTIGELTDINWQHIDPEGFRKMLGYLKNRYPEIPIFITENGFRDLQKPEATIKELLNDTKRIQIHEWILGSFTSSNTGWSRCEGLFRMVTIR